MIARIALQGRPSTVMQASRLLSPTALQSPRLPSSATVMQASRLHSPRHLYGRILPLSVLIVAAVASIASAAQPPAPALKQAPKSSVSAAEKQLLSEISGVYRAVGNDLAARRLLPIGLFDSGTGGLTVLEAMLVLDHFDNTTHRPCPGGDGRRDYENERFQFLADQANMPYGQYPAAGKRQFLVDLALKDACFLLGRQYDRLTGPGGAINKQPAKTVVIACNTATAYGKNRITSAVGEARAPVDVIGVIDAGAKGAVAALKKDIAATIGVLATQGTVSSGAYPAAIDNLTRATGWAGPVQVVQQGSIGLAGAIDGTADFLAAPKGHQVRSGYQGPAIGHATAPVDRDKLSRYDFDWGGGQMLYEGTVENPGTVQLNSVANYVAYDTTMLLEQARRAGGKGRLSVVILGCTHFPYCAEQIAAELARLRNYQEGGSYIYRHLMADKITLVDPAVHVAETVYERLARAKLLATLPPLRHEPRGEFYITVPNAAYAGAQLDSAGQFTFAYKYGRTAALATDDVLAVPITAALLGPDNCSRLSERVPYTWKLVNDFGRYVAAGRN